MRSLNTIDYALQYSNGACLEINGPNVRQQIGNAMNNLTTTIRKCLSAILVIWIISPITAQDSTEESPAQIPTAEVQLSSATEELTIEILSEVISSDFPNLIDLSVNILDDPNSDWFATIEFKFELVVDQFDRDKNGGLSEEEMFSLPMQDNHRPFELIFDQNDVDSDGIVSVEEIMEMFDWTLTSTIDEFGLFLSSFESILSLAPTEDHPPVEPLDEAQAPTDEAVSP